MSGGEFTVPPVVDFISVTELLRCTLIPSELLAWESYEYPGITEVGDETYEYEAPYVTGGLRETFVENETLVEAGVTFTPVSKLDEGVVPDGFEYGEAAYRLVCGGVINPADMEEERTIASRIALGEDSVAVTFDAECADKYPSIHHLAPGNPLLAQLVEIFVEECNETKRLDWEACYRDGIDVIPLVVTWGRDGEFGRITVDGDVELSGATEVFAN